MRSSARGLALHFVRAIKVKWPGRISETRCHSIVLLIPWLDSEDRIAKCDGLELRTRGTPPNFYVRSGSHGEEEVTPNDGCPLIDGNLQKVDRPTPTVSQRGFS